MNRKSIVKSFFGLFAAVCAALAFVVADVGALSQNTNSSNTEQNTNGNTATQDENTNANTGRRGRRRGRRRAAPAADTNANADASGAMTENTNTSDAMPAQDAGAADTQNTGGGTQEDLSGTYAGRVRMSGGHEMNADGTVTITGNTFSITAEGMTHNGRIYAVNTRRYIGAALIFEDLTDPVTNTPLACSVRVRTGRTFSATPVPGSRNKCWFSGRSSG